MATTRSAMLVPSSELSWLALTSDQAHILNQIIHRHRAGITECWSHGIFDGLSNSLCEIENAGGAYIREGPLP
jgi:hypothetical protein